MKQNTHVIHHIFIKSKSLNLKDKLVPSSFPVLERLWVERHGPGQEVDPANDLVDDEKDVASDNQESDSCFRAGKREAPLAVIFKLKIKIIQHVLLFINALKPKQIIKILSGKYLVPILCFSRYFLSCSVYYSCL